MSIQVYPDQLLISVDNFSLVWRNDGPLNFQALNSQVYPDREGPLNSQIYLDPTLYLCLLFQSGMEKRGALLEYFHDTGEAKISAVREYVLDLLEADRKFLLFAHHQSVLNAIEEAVRPVSYQPVLGGGEWESVGGREGR